MPRLLAIDYGKKRTGIAVTDPAQIIANPLTTVDTHRLVDYLRGYAKREEVERFVIGLPTQSDGTPSETKPASSPSPNASPPPCPTSRRLCTTSASPRCWPTAP